MSFHENVLQIDPAQETGSVVDFVADEVHSVFRRNGIIVGISGGVDSAVMAAIAVQALGKDNVLGLILPEKESSPLSQQYAARHAESLGIEYRTIDITTTVDSVFPYAKRDKFIKEIVPGYTPECKYNIVLPADLLDRDAYSVYSLTVQFPDGKVLKKRMSMAAFRTLTAFADIKIRSRMLHLYAEAERCNFVVAGTTNRTEMILGDFCKYGDGGTDIEALAHLYKAQVYQIGRYLDVIPEILDRIPSPDTFSLPVSDQEFFFRIPFEKLDLLLFAWEHDIGGDETAAELNLSVDAVTRCFADFTTKNRTTRHLREMPHSLD